MGKYKLDVSEIMLILILIYGDQTPCEHPKSLKKWIESMVT